MEMPSCQQQPTKENITNINLGLSPVKNLNNYLDNSGLEHSLTLATGIGIALLHENEDLKQEVHNLKLG